MCARKERKKEFRNFKKAYRERQKLVSLVENLNAVTSDIHELATRLKNPETKKFYDQIYDIVDRAHAIDKPVIQKFVTAFQGKFGDKSPVVFGAHSFDVSVLLERIVPVAKKTAKPGTPEFRKALRDALESQTEIAEIGRAHV